MLRNIAFAVRSKKASGAIVGKWHVQGTKDTVEFRKNGTFINSHSVFAGPPGNTHTFKEESSGKYNFTDGNHVYLEASTGNTNKSTISIQCKVHIHGGKMDMTMPMPGESQQHKVNFNRLD